MSNITRIRVTIEVAYNLDGQPVEDVQSMLQHNLEKSIGNGLLTGDTDLEVEKYSVETTAWHAPGQPLPAVSNLLTFAGLISRMSVWDFEKPNGDKEMECECPAWGYLDSHNTLMELILQARALKVAPDPTVFVADAPKDSQDYFCIGADGNLWILGNHGDYEAAEDTAQSLGIDVIWLFGEATAAYWKEKLESAASLSSECSS